MTGCLAFTGHWPLFSPIMRPPSYRQRLFVEHYPGKSSGAAVAAARRAGYPWTEQMARKMLRNVEKRGVQAARNGPSEDSKCWQRIELGIHGLRSWSRNWSRKVRATRNSGGLQGHEGGRDHPLSGVREAWLAPNVPLATVLPLHATPHAAGRKLAWFYLLDSASIRSKSQSANGSALSQKTHR